MCKISFPYEAKICRNHKFQHIDTNIEVLKVEPLSVDTLLPTSFLLLESILEVLFRHILQAMSRNYLDIWYCTWVLLECFTPGWKIHESSVAIYIVMVKLRIGGNAWPYCFDSSLLSFAQLYMYIICGGLFMWCTNSWLTTFLVSKKELSMVFAFVLFILSYFGWQASVCTIRHFVVLSLIVLKNPRFFTG